MRMPGSGRSRPRRFLGRVGKAGGNAGRAGAIVAALLGGAAAEALVPYRIDGDGIAAPLTGQAGHSVRGRAIVLAREVSTCLLCHGGPFPEERFQATIGPSLSGIGARLSESQIRLRVVNAAAVNPETVMPSFYTTTGLTRVGRQWEGRPVLSADQIEDVVAYLVTLRTP